MKRQFLFASYIPAILLGLTITSCSSDDDSATDSTPTVVEAAKAPDFTIYSGETTLYTTLDTRTVAAAAVDVNATIASSKGVEVNLSVNTAKTYADYIATKLSIHVRDVANPTITIPVPAEYYCSVSSVAGVLSHKYASSQYGTTETTLTIAGNAVKATVTYGETAITVKVEGINQAVLDKLNADYSDGVTFEVWTYYKNSFPKNGSTINVTRTALKEMFDESTISFGEQIPAKYTNAFGAINDYDGIVYNKAVFTEYVGDVFVNDYVNTPYVDAGFNTELSTDYWTRSADPRYYTLKTTKNEWDCTVTPDATGYTLYDEATLGLVNAYNVVYAYTPIYEAE